jgi:hypothetical protein
MIFTILCPAYFITLQQHEEAAAPISQGVLGFLT